MEREQSDSIVMRLLHYFITIKNYSPVIIQGLQDEIWLENMKEEYRIVRIVSKHIHNTEQLDFDIYKAKKISKSIKKQTFSLNMKILSIYMDMGENAKLKEVKNMALVPVYEENDLYKNEKLKSIFPDLKKKLIKDEEKGMDLYLKITADIHNKNNDEIVKTNEIFKRKIPYITYILLALNIVIFLYYNLIGTYDYVLNEYCLHGSSVRNGEYYRLITSMFLHGDLIHLIFNSYALYIFGSQIESYFGKIKYIIIYLFSGIVGSLLSITLSDTASIGASGAIFGLMGSLLYFGYHYRVYLGTTLKSQLIPLIVLNLMYGFMVPGIDNFAHIGGLIGGVLITSSIGVKYKEDNVERINAIIVTTIFILFLIYLAIFAAR